MPRVRLAVGGRRSFEENVSRLAIALFKRFFVDAIFTPKFEYRFFEFRKISTGLDGLEWHSDSEQAEQESINENSRRSETSGSIEQPVLSSNRQDV